jgi:hypothetical protein
VGTIYTLIANDGTDAVVGTFAGLPEGKIFTANGQLWQISYVGGDGNDVTLQAVPRPRPRPSRASGWQRARAPRRSAIQWSSTTPT